MKKLMHLRQHLIDSVPWLANNPEMLLTFIDKGEIHHVPRSQSLSHLKKVPVSLVITEFSGSEDDIITPILAWLELHQADRHNDRALVFNAEIINNDQIDLEITLELTESIIVNESNGSFTAISAGEPIYRGDLPMQLPVDTEWVISGHND